MAIFITRKHLELCHDYDVLINECLQVRGGEFCCGWTWENYSSLECIWKCLTADVNRVLQDITVLCHSDLQAHSKLAREICKEYKELWQW